MTDVKNELKPYTLEELFRNEQFRRFASFFLEDARTVLEVEELSGISRQTISSILERGFKGNEEYYDHRYIGTILSKRGKPIQLKPEFITAYLSQKLEFTQEETTVLDSIVAQESMHKAIISGNILLDMALMKTLGLAMMVALRNQIEIEDTKYDERTKYFGEALQKAYKEAPKVLMQDIKKLVPSGDIPLPFGLDSIKNEPVEPWLKEYTKNNRKSLASMLVKMRSSTFPIVISLSDLYDNFLGKVGGVLYVKRRLEIGNKDWIEQHTKFRAELKTKKKKVGVSK